MTGMSEVVKTSYEKRAETPGKTVSLEVKDALSMRTVEMMHPPGMISAPTTGDIVTHVDATGRVRVAIASRNYRIEIAVAAGETVIYSTNTAGDAVKASIKLDTDGKITVKNDSKSLATLISDLIDTVKGLTTVGSPNNHTVSAASQALLDTKKTDFLALLKE